MCWHDLYRTSVNIDKIGLFMRHKHSLLQPEPIHRANSTSKLTVFVLLRKFPCDLNRRERPVAMFLHEIAFG